MQSFFELNLNQWQDLCSSLGEKPYRAKQIFEWIYQKKVFSPDEMTNIKLSLKKHLRENLEWTLPEKVSVLDSSDGATKLLLKTKTGQMTETVILRYEDRTSLCVSSQVGCKLACKFCQTGKLGFVRHLSGAEILEQYAVAQQIVAKEGRSISHVVFMGMGEPLDNYEATAFAVQRLVGEGYFNLSKRHVTVSTSGIVPKIKQLADMNLCSLAVSLHACNDELRTDMMPINRRYSLSELKSALLYFQKQTNLKVMIEYILIKDKNCSQRHAKELMQFLEGLKSKVNLIPFNSHPGMPFQKPETETVTQFQKYLADRSIPAPVRYSKGLDVSAACGQLAAKKVSELKKAPSRQSLLTLKKSLLTSERESSRV